MADTVDSKVDALLYAFESGEGIDLLVQSLRDSSREVREFAYWLLTETQTEFSRRALRNYLPYPEMLCLHAIKGRNKVQPNYFAISADRKTLLSNCYSQTGKYDAYTTINVWNLQTGMLVNDFYLLHEHIGTGQDGKIIVGCFEHVIQVLEGWQPHYPRMLFPCLADDEEYEFKSRKANAGIGSLAVSHDGSIIACGEYGPNHLKGHIVLWNVHTEKVIHSIEWQPVGGLSCVFSLVLSSDGSVLLSQDEKHFAHPHQDLHRLWNVQTGELIRDFETSSHWVAHEIATTLEGRYIASGIRDNMVKVWDILTDQVICSFLGCSPTAMTPDGRVLAYCNDIDGIVLWDLDVEQKICSLPGSASSIKAICLSSDREWVVSYDANETIKIYGLPDE